MENFDMLKNIEIVKEKVNKDFKLFHEKKKSKSKNHHKLSIGSPEFLFGCRQGSKTDVKLRLRRHKDEYN